MPTYEFRCPSGHDFEKFYRSIAAAPSEVTCPECGKVAARQMSAGAGLVFKGSGFYITDYGKDGKKQQSATASPGGSKPDASAASEKTSTSSGSDAQKSESKSTAPETAASKPAPAPPSQKSPKSNE